jgi:predicted PurR-regulated permease PerM
VLKESELDDILDKINSLASKINTNQIEYETNEARSQSQQLLDRADQVAMSLNYSKADFNRTNNNYESEKNKSDALTQSYNEYLNSNEAINSELGKVILVFFFLVFLFFDYKLYTCQIILIESLVFFLD